MSNLDDPDSSAMVDRLDETRFLAELRTDDSLDVTGYVAILRGLACTYSVVERFGAGAAVPQPAGASHLRDGDRTSMLCEDLLHYRYRLVPDRRQPRDTALAFADVLRGRLHETPSEAGAYLAVFDHASALVGARLVGTSERSASTDGSALADRGASNPGFGFFRTLAGRLAEGHPAATAATSGVGGSSATGLTGEARAEAEDFVASLLTAASAAGPPDGAAENACPVTSYTMNPTGGAYPATQDHDELIAALHATDTALARNPYYLYRFGPAGYLFADSDGAWLATLPELGEAAMLGQVRWLTTVLSSRGMPSFLVARHLRILADELCRYVPDRTDRWTLVRSTADAIAPVGGAFDRLSLRHVPRFRESVPAHSAFAANEAGELIVGAVLDERSGISGAQPGLVGWYTDSERFPDSWVSAAHALAESVAADAEAAVSAGESG